MKAKHTPGPWVWDGITLRAAHRDSDASSVHSILDAEGGYGFLGSKSSETLAELDADRALIAASPLLFDALEVLYDALTTGAGRDFIEAFTRNAAVALEAASPGWMDKQSLTREELRARVAT